MNRHNSTKRRPGTHPFWRDDRGREASAEQIFRAAQCPSWLIRTGRVVTTASEVQILVSRSRGRG